MQGKEGFSLVTYSAHTLRASHPWVTLGVAYTLRLYNYLLRFYLTMPPPLKRIVPNPLYT